MFLETGATACDFTREVRVGVNTSLSGKYGFLGPSARKAASMAEDDVNDGGGLMTGNRYLKVRCARRPAVIVRYDRGVRSYVSTFAAE